MKVCTICRISQPDEWFYKRPSGALYSHCKSCVNEKGKKRYRSIKNDPALHDKHKKYLQTRYANRSQKGFLKKRVSAIDQKERDLKNSKLYEIRFPEKITAHRSIPSSLRSVGFDLHHWSYNEEHFKDVIKLPSADHAAVHKFMVYDQERRMYRRTDNNELLDTKVSHEDYISFCIETKIKIVEK